MTKYLDELKSAADFRQLLPTQNVFAFGVEWERRFSWTDKGLNIGHEYFVAQGMPVFQHPEIWVDEKEYDMTGYSEKADHVYFGGEFLFSVSDDWGRIQVALWPSEFDFSNSTPQSAYTDWKKASELFPGKLGKVVFSW